MDAIGRGVFYGIVSMAWVGFTAVLGVRDVSLIYTRVIHSPTLV